MKLKSNLCLLLAWFACCTGTCIAQSTETNWTQLVLQDRAFREGLFWTGTNEPSRDESRRLYEILTHWQTLAWAGEVETFLKNNPNSPWAASLHHDYASYCRRCGRTTKALEHWEAAWQLVKNDPSPTAKEVGGAVLANWMEQLSSLGRLQQLGELVPAGDNWSFGTRQDREKFLGAKNAYYLMQLHPETSFRCGTFALKAVGLSLQPTNRALDELVSVFSPSNGFTVAALVEMAKQYGLPLVPVRRIKGQDLIVPSVIHWRQNHYAAILDAKDGNYLIDDPTFGRPRWLLPEAINEEASGVFLIPITAQTSAFAKLEPGEMAAVHGMGLPSNVNDGHDRGCGRDFSGNIVCPPCKGMPTWWVSEPYVNLWLADEPISYATSQGEAFPFRMTYKQRDTSPTRTNGSRVAITGWNNSWLSFISVVGGACTSGSCSAIVGGGAVTVYLPNGGEVSFTFNGSDPVYDPETRLLLQLSGVDHFELQSGPDRGDNGLRLIHADGSQDIYNQVIPHTVGFGEPQETEYLRSRHVDPNGNTTWFYYENTAYIQARLKYVVDPDGRTNTLSYLEDDVHAITRLTQVQNPYGQTAQFQYDSSYNLTNIIDAISNQTRLTYDTNGYPTTMVTPYGTTTFRLADLIVQNNVAGEGNFGNHNMIDRAAEITDAGGFTQAYLYRYDCSGFMATNYSSGDVPTSTPLGTLDDGSSGGTNFLTGTCYRNSFAWGPAQFAGVLANDTNISAASVLSLTNLTANDYLRGRMRHWLQDTNLITTYVTGLLSVERTPSPDGTTEGLKTFYDYQGKTYNFVAGTNSLPSVMAWRLPGSETHYEYVQFDSFGNITNLTTTYTTSSNTLGTRATQFTYSNNIYTQVIGELDGTNVSNTLSNSFSVNNLLTQIIGPDTTNIMTTGSFDTVTWTNDIILTNLGYTNRVTLTSHRVIPSTIKDAANQTASLAFTGFNKVSGITFPSGQIVTPTYYSDHNPPTATSSRLQQIEVEPQGLFIHIDDYSNGLPRVVRLTGTGLTSLTVTNTWDALDRPTGTTFPDNTTVSNVYTKLDLTSRKDRLGNWTYFGYDNLQHLTSITDPSNNITQFGWCGCGALTSLTDASNKTTTLLYDNRNALTNISFPDGASLSYTYDLAQRLTDVADGSLHTAHLVLNNQGLATLVSSGPSNLLSVQYDIFDRPHIVTDANGISVTHTFDALSRLVLRTWTNNVNEGFGYSSNGLTLYTNCDQKLTQFGRDNGGRLTSVTDANSNVFQFGYNAADLITSLTYSLNGTNRTTSWFYNEYLWLTRKVDANSNDVFRLQRDANGNVTNRWTPAFTNTTYTYDLLNNLKTISYPGYSFPSVTYDYDTLYQLKAMVDAAGTTAFTFTETGHIKSEDGPWVNDTLTYSYSQGQRTNMSIGTPTPFNIGYVFDSLLRMTNLVSSAGSFTYQYPASASQLIQRINLPNGAYVSNHFDSLKRQDGTALVNFWGHVLDGYTYGQDALGLRTNLTRDFGVATSTAAMTYDNIGQLTSWTGKESNGTSRLNEQLGWGYDAVGNLHLRTNGGLVQTFTVDNVNQVTAITRSGTLTVSGATPAPAAANVTVNGNAADRYGDLTFAKSGLSVTNNGNNTYTIVASNAYNLKVTNTLTANLPTSVSPSFDLNGNLLTDGTRNFVYNGENQLTNVYVTNQWKTEFVYDGLGRRRMARDYIWQSTNWVRTAETRYVCDGMLPVQERDSNNTVLVTYTRGLDLSGSLTGAGGIGGLLARTDSSNSSTYYHADGAGNITALMDAQQNVVARYLRDPFGRLLGQWGSMASLNTMQFSSQPLHANSGLTIYPFRAYDANLQRWLSQDPIGESGGYNMYRFNLNDPANLIDPTGFGVWGWLSDATFGWLGNLIYTTPGKTQDQYDLQAFAAANEQRLINQGKIDPNEFYDFAAMQRAFGLNNATQTAGNVPAVAAGATAAKDITLGYVTVQSLIASPKPTVCPTAAGTSTAAKTLAADAPDAIDHIVLGLERHGLEDTAANVGGRVLLADPNWRSTLQAAVLNPNTRFTVSLDGLAGSTPYSQVMGAVQRGVLPGATPTNWELAQLYQAGRLADVNFVSGRGTVAVQNPFK